MPELPNTRILAPATTASKGAVYAIPCPRCGVPEGEACWFSVKTFALAHKERWQKFSLLPVREFRVLRPHTPKQAKEVLIHKNWKQSVRAHAPKGRTGCAVQSTARANAMR